MKSSLRKVAFLGLLAAPAALPIFASAQACTPATVVQDCGSISGYQCVNGSCQYVGSGSGQTQQGGVGSGQTQQPGAGSGQAQGGTRLVNPLSSGTNLEGFLRAILSVVTTIGTIVIVLALVYVGFLFATTSVNPENKTKAREALLWTLVGALILLGAQAIALGIQETVKALGSGT